MFRLGNLNFLFFSIKSLFEISKKWNENLNKIDVTVVKEPSFYDDYNDERKKFQIQKLF